MWWVFVRWVAGYVMGVCAENVCVVGVCVGVCHVCSGCGCGQCVCVCARVCAVGGCVVSLGGSHMRVCAVGVCVVSLGGSHIRAWFVMRNAYD